MAVYMYHKASPILSLITTTSNNCFCKSNVLGESATLYSSFINGVNISQYSIKFSGTIWFIKIDIFPHNLIIASAALCNPSLATSSPLLASLIFLLISVLFNSWVNTLFALLETAKYPITFEKADLNPGKIISTAINPPKTKSHGINVINAAVCIFCVTLPPHLSMITLAFIPNCDKTINAKYMAKPYILNFV